jgi:hypothetical protein
MLSCIGWAPLFKAHRWGIASGVTVARLIRVRRAGHGLVRDVEGVHG